MNIPNTLPLSLCPSVINPALLPVNCLSINSRTGASLYYPEHLEWRGAWVTLRKDPPNWYCSSFSQPSPKGPVAFYQSNYNGEKEIIRPLRTTGHRFWADTNSRRPKVSPWPTLPSRGWWRSGDQWSFSSGPSHRGFSGSPNPPPCGYSGHRMHKWSRHT